MLWGNAVSHGAGQERGDVVAKQVSERARSWWWRYWPPVS